MTEIYYIEVQDVTDQTGIASVEATELVTNYTVEIEDTETAYTVQVEEVIAVGGGDSIFDNFDPNDGDIIRFNESSGAWETRSEPFDFKQINLIPQTTPLEDTAGGIIFKDNSIYVCREQ